MMIGTRASSPSSRRAASIRWWPKASCTRLPCLRAMTPSQSPTLATERISVSIFFSLNGYLSNLRIGLGSMLESRVLIISDMKSNSCRRLGGYPPVGDLCRRESTRRRSIGELLAVRYECKLRTRRNDADTLTNLDHAVMCVGVTNCPFVLVLKLIEYEMSVLGSCKRKAVDV